MQRNYQQIEELKPFVSLASLQVFCEAKWLFCGSNYCNIFNFSGKVNRNKFLTWSPNGSYLSKIHQLTRNRDLILLISIKIKIWIVDEIEIYNFWIFDVICSSAFQILEHSLYCIPMTFTWLMHEPIKYLYSKSHLKSTTQSKPKYHFCQSPLSLKTLQIFVANKARLNLLEYIMPQPPNLIDLEIMLNVERWIFLQESMPNQMNLEIMDSILCMIDYGI